MLAEHLSTLTRRGVSEGHHQLQMVPLQPLAKLPRRTRACSQHQLSSSQAVWPPLLCTMAPQAQARTCWEQGGRPDRRAWSHMHAARLTSTSWLALWRARV